MTQFLSTITVPEEREEVIYAYHQRRENLGKISEPLDEDAFKRIAAPPERQIDFDDMAKVIQNMEGEGLSYHTFSDIGRFTVFPENHYKRMFPRKSFGNIDKDDFEKTKMYALMTREEGL